MYRFIYGTIFAFLTLAALVLPVAVFAIDGEYVSPYADSLDQGQCAQGDQECINSRPGANKSELPVMTLLGGGLLLIGFLAAVVWKIRTRKRNTDSPA